MRRFIAVGAALVAVLGACSTASHHAARPTTTTVPNPDVIPAVITPAYVDSVFVVLNHVYGDATRTLRATRTVTPGAEADLRAVFSDSVYESQLAAARDAITKGVINNVRRNAGDLVTHVIHIISGDRGCIFVEATTDFSPVEIRPTPAPASEYYEFRPKENANDPLHLNSTPWAIAAEEAFLTSTTVANPCGG